jgi:hypothetical protein
VKFQGLLTPWTAWGKPFGKLKEARVHTQLTLPPVQALTGWLNVTTVGTGYTLPVAQFGVQLLSLAVPVPTAVLVVHEDQVMPDRYTVESPDS